MPSCSRERRQAFRSQLHALYLLVIPRGEPEVLILLYLYDSWKCVGTVFGRRMCLFKLNQPRHWRGPSHSSFHLFFMFSAIKCSAWIHVYIFSLASYTVGAECVRQNMKAVQLGLSCLCAWYKARTLFFFFLSLVHQCSLWLRPEWYLYPSW